MPEPAPEYPLFRCKNFYDHDPPCLDGWVRAQGIICTKCIERGWFDMTESKTRGSGLEYENSSAGIQGGLSDRCFYDGGPIEGDCFGITDETTLDGSNSPALTGSTIFTTRALVNGPHNASF